jgi:DnaA-homolog protein
MYHKNSKQQLILDPRMHTRRKTFANFIGSENIKTALKHYASNPSGELITLWGNTGCGRSHLLQSLPSFTPSAYYSPAAEQTPNNFSTLETKTILLLDDAHLLLENPDLERAFFILLNNRKTANLLTFICLNSPPERATVRLHDLHSRLQGGIDFEIPNLNDQQKILALQQIAQKQGFTLPNPVANYLMAHCPRNMQALMSFLHHLDWQSLSQQRPLTIPLLKSLLNNT